MKPRLLIILCSSIFFLQSLGCAYPLASTGDTKMPPAVKDKPSIKKLSNCKIENRKRVCIA